MRTFLFALIAVCFCSVASAQVLIRVGPSPNMNDRLHNPFPHRGGAYPYHRPYPYQNVWTPYPAPYYSNPHYSRPNPYYWSYHPYYGWYYRPPVYVPHKKHPRL